MPKGGKRPGAGRKTNAGKGLEPPGVTISARIATAEAQWAKEQALIRFPTLSAYIEHLIRADRTGG